MLIQSHMIILDVVGDYPPTDPVFRRMRSQANVCFVTIFLTQSNLLPKNIGSMNKICLKIERSRSKSYRSTGTLKGNRIVRLKLFIRKESPVKYGHNYRLNWSKDHTRGPCSLHFAISRVWRILLRLSPRVR